VAVLAVLIVRVTVPEPPTAGPLVAQRTAAPAPEQRPATRPAQPAPAAPSEAPARVEAKRKQAPQRVPSAAAEVEEQRREAEAVPPPPALESTVRLAETRPVAPQEPVPPLPPAERPPAQAIAMRSASDQAAPSPRDLYYLSLAVRQESTRFAPSAARSARAGAGGVVGGVPAVPGVLGLRYSWAEGRLVVEANTSAYLEISAGRRRVVSRQTEPQRRYTIEVPGEETRLKLILSRRQRADAAELDRPAGQRAAGADGAVYVVVADAGPDAYLAVEVPVPAGR
jgi:hypothetical protein